jgi:NAD(P)-dependent dehydrogenase (short-subunit alcohol dehydrogenase family)
MMKNVLVTGANSGIGLALTKQICKDYGVKVYLGSRNAERGAKAVEEVKEYCGGTTDDIVELIVIDVSNNDSVKAAAESLKSKDVKLSAIVNNAGTGLGHPGITNDDMINVNYYGTKRVVDNFLPLLETTTSDPAKIINVGSGAGPMYIQTQPEERKKRLCNPDITVEEIESIASAGLTEDDPSREKSMLGGAYSLSKALVYAYTMYTAKAYADQNIISMSLSPGFIATKMIPEEYKGMGAKPVEQGTISLKHCLFETTRENNGWYYGSDAKRSPPHFLRNPGEPEWDGQLPW